MKLPVCPVHGTELKIRGPHYLVCGQPMSKGTRHYKCPHCRYWAADLPDRKTQSQ